MTYRERLERAAARRENWAEKAAARSAAAMETARSITQYIPLGQPILAGHHSEAGHRRALDRSAAAMDKGVTEWQKAEHHQQKAAGIARRLESCIFDDDEDAAEKPEREILTALKAAGYRWQKCCWSGLSEKLPQSVKELASTAEGQAGQPVLF